MLLVAHLILLHALLITLLSYLFEDSYNVHERHYRSVSGMLAISGAPGQFVASMANMAVFLIYSNTAQISHTKNMPILNFAGWLAGAGMICFDSINTHTVHLLFLLLFIIIIILNHTCLAYKYAQLRFHVYILLTVTKTFTFFLLFYTWSNWHTFIEIMWLLTIYYNLCVLTYWNDYIHTYNALITV